MERSMAASKGGGRSSVAEAGEIHRRRLGMRSTLMSLTSMTGINLSKRYLFLGVANPNKSQRHAHKLRNGCRDAKNQKHLLNL
ncbi:hypothetical protein YC2023_021382 [Brassica napus]